MTLRTILARVSSSGRTTLIVVWVALTLASTAWAVTTPLSASPDEPDHIIRAASVAHGEIIGRPTGMPAVTKVEVPVGIAQAARWKCYAANPAASAGCMIPTVNGSKLVPSTTSAGLYNPIYYAMVGLPSLVFSNTRLDVFSMRVLSAALSCLFLAFTFTMMIRILSPLIAGVAFFAAITPMVLFLNGSVNPNSLEIGAGAAFATGLAAVALDRTGRRQTAVLTVTTIAAVLLANSRGLSPLWMAVIGCAVLVLMPFSRTRALLRQRSVLIALLVMALGVVFAGAWIYGTGTLGAMGTFVGAGETGPVRAFFVMIVDQSANPGIIGYFGWLDTPAPGIVYFLWSGLIFGVLVLALASARGRNRAALIFSIGTVLLVPPMVQAASVATSGYIWQGRYTLVAVVVALIFAAIAVDSARDGIVIAAGVARSFIVVVGVVVLLGQLDSMVGAIRRYAAPGAPSVFAFLTTPAWTPPGGSLPWLALAAVSLSVPLLVWWSAVDGPQRGIQTSRALSSQG